MWRRRRPPRTLRRQRALAATVLAAPAALVALLPGSVHADGAATGANFAQVVSRIEQLPYQPAYVPVRSDTAFPSGLVLNEPGATDYTSGSLANSSSMPNTSYDPTGVSGAPPWPSTFTQTAIRTPDGATLTGWYHLDTSGASHPGVVVVHGFNTHGVWSVIRWAAMLAADGYNVAAFDQRDFSDDTDTRHPQSFGYAEAQDVVTVGRWLASRPGVGPIGLVGFSEGAQNTVLALADDTSHVFRAALTFSAPSDQDTQVWSTRTPGCTGGCQYPETDALISLVVPAPPGQPPYSDPCRVLTDAGTAYHLSPYELLVRESALHAQTRVTVPLLNFYAADDSLVPDLEAALMAGYELGNPLQKTLSIVHGEHAYFFDRWWQQQAILLYFKAMLPSGSGVSAAPTVNQTPGGASLQSQEAAIVRYTPAQVDEMMAPFVCGSSQRPPGVAARDFFGAPPFYNGLPSASSTSSPGGGAASGPPGMASAGAGSTPNTSAPDLGGLAALIAVAGLAGVALAAGGHRRGFRCD